MISDQISNSIIDECLNTNKNCKNCIYCAADVKIWQSLDDHFKKGEFYLQDLHKYYEIRRKRTIFEQIEKNTLLKLSEAETLVMLSRY